MLNRKIRNIHNEEQPVGARKPIPEELINLNTVTAGFDLTWKNKLRKCEKGKNIQKKLKFSL